MNILKSMLTEADGVSWCPARALLILGALAFIGLAIYTALNGKLFDPQAYGLGYGGLLAGGGGGILMKGKVE